MVQQLTAGSLDVTLSTGLVDPIRAIDKGAPIAIVRSNPVAALCAACQARDQERRGLQGKTISSAAPRTSPGYSSNACWRRAASSPASSTMVFAGATAARARRSSPGRSMPRSAAALQFPGRARGFNELGLTFDFCPTAVLRHGRQPALGESAMPACCKRLLDAHAKASPGSTTRSNREAAVKIRWRPARSRTTTSKGLRLSARQEFVRADRQGLARRKRRHLIDALRDLGDVPAGFTVDRAPALPGVTQVTSDAMSATSDSVKDP